MACQWCDALGDGCPYHNAEKKKRFDEFVALGQARKPKKKSKPLTPQEEAKLEKAVRRLRGPD